MFFLFSGQLLQDVVYSLKDSLFFVLLKTSEVIIFDATTNPCSARQLWVAPSNRQLLSIALVSLQRSLSLSPPLSLSPSLSHS